MVGAWGVNKLPQARNQSFCKFNIEIRMEERDEHFLSLLWTLFRWLLIIQPQNISTEITLFLERNR